MSWIDHYKEKAAQDCFDGTDVLEYTEKLRHLAITNKCRTLLDYGCGSGYQYYVHDMHKSLRMRYNDIELYDPAFEAYDIPLKKTYDMVICSNVLNYIPAHEMDHTVDRILSLANKVVFFSFGEDIGGPFTTKIGKDYARSIMSHPFKKNKGLRINIQYKRRTDGRV